MLALKEVGTKEDAVRMTRAGRRARGKMGRSWGTLMGVSDGDVGLTLWFRSKKVSRPMGSPLPKLNSVPTVTDSSA